VAAARASHGEAALGHGAGAGCSGDDYGLRAVVSCQFSDKGLRLDALTPPSPRAFCNIVLNEQFTRYVPCKLLIYNELHIKILITKELMTVFGALLVQIGADSSVNY
jgi:hypothetical protein